MIIKQTIYDLSDLERDVNEFSKLNKLNEDELKELNFIVKAFFSFHSTFKKTKQKFEEKEIVDLFDSVIDLIINSYNNNGLQTKSYLYFKLLPIIDNIRTSKETLNLKEIYEQLCTSEINNKFLDNDTFGMCAIVGSDFSISEQPKTNNNVDYGSCFGFNDYGYC